jgi:quercetin dioxygenase-like cupin family protein
VGIVHRDCNWPRFPGGSCRRYNATPEKAHGVNVGTTSALDLGAELDTLEGRQLRVRLITFEPGGAVPLHSHNGRPGIAHVLKGSLTEHVEGKGVFERHEGDRLIEDRNTVHWVENRTDQTAMVLASDVYKP